MSPQSIIIIIAVVAFVVALITITFVYRWRQGRGSNGKLHRSFGRHSAPKSAIPDELRKPIFSDLKDKKENRGRLYAFGLVIAAIFGTIAMRLWSLQLMSGDQYTKQAVENMTSDASTPAIRGRILDRNGNVLVDNKPSLRLLAPKASADNPIVVQMLSLLLGVPKGIIRKKILDDNQGAQANRIIADDVPMHVIGFIKEHPQLFADIEIIERTIRVYPNGNTGAHILGYIGAVNQADMQLPQEVIYYEGGDFKGRDGAEAAFENLLQGARGTRTYKVDVDGNPLALIAEAPPKNGSDVCLTIDLELQKATDKILSDIITSSIARGFIHANAGAIVCIDVEDGGILASSSYPTYNPEELVNAVDEDVWAGLTSEDNDTPLLNRVISGNYPAASTFKAFVSLAGLENGIIAGNTTFNCEGTWYPGEEGQWGQNCWIAPGAHGYLTMEEAINESCDVFFYEVGAAFFNRWNRQFESAKTDTLQDYFKSWGFNAVTGVELGGESAGRIPTPAWKLEAFPDAPEASQWILGDMVNMCIGQGDVLVTPLQLCNGFAGIAREKMLVPHLLHQVLNSDGEAIVSNVVTESAVQPKFDDYSMARVKDGLGRVVARMGGIFNELPVVVAGKSGTAEVLSAEDDLNWFVAYAPANDPKYCVACVIENGGWGSSSALLGVQHTLAAIYDVDVGEVHVEEGAGEG